VIEKLDPLFKELADLVGQLAGNEAAWSILYNQAMEIPVGDGWTRATTNFTVPGTYGWTKTKALYVIMSADNPDMATSEVTNEDRERIVQKAITDAWHKAHDSWTTGSVSSGYRSTSQNIWEPDPAAMSGPVDGLYYLAQWLYRQDSGDSPWVQPGAEGAPEWLTNLKAGWPNTALSSESFYAFWDDVDDKCARYAIIAGRLAKSCGQVTYTLSDFQTNLVEVTTKARDRAKEALLQWQTWKMDSGAWPTGGMTDNSGIKMILGGISYGAGTIGAVPSPLTGPLAGISIVTGGLSYLIEEKSVEMEATKAATADQISTGFVNDLTTMDGEMTKALNVIRTDPPNEHVEKQGDRDPATGDTGLQAYAADVVKRRSDLTPPNVRL